MEPVKIHTLRRGTTLVEAAIVVPLLLLLTFGLLEYGWLFIKSQQLGNAAREGARLAATPDATNATVNARISSLMSDAGMGGSGYTVTLTPSDVAAAATGESVKVSISVAYANVSVAGASMVPVPSTLGAAVSAMKEGP